MSDYDGCDDHDKIEPELGLMIKAWLLENKTFYEGWRLVDDGNDVSICRGSNWCFYVREYTVHVYPKYASYSDEKLDAHDPMFFAKLGAKIMAIEATYTPTLGSLGIL